jgi:anthranilate synthase component 1
MYHPSKQEFIKLAGKSNVIPVYKEILADTLTPVSAFRKAGKDIRIYWNPWRVRKK